MYGYLPHPPEGAQSLAAVRWHAARRSHLTDAAPVNSRPLYCTLATWTGMAVAAGGSLQTLG